MADISAGAGRQPDPARALHPRFGRPTAYAAQIALLLTFAASLCWQWRSDAAFELKASAPATASLLATPYVLDYDLVVLAVAIAFSARHGLVRRVLSFEILLTMYVVTLRRAALARWGFAAAASGIAQA